MTLRFSVFGIELASVEIDFGDQPEQPGQPIKETPVDRIADYFTRRFIKRKLLP